MSKSIKVYQYTLEGNYSQEFESSREIERVLNIPHNNITRAIKTNGTAGGYRWSKQKLEVWQPTEAEQKASEGIQDIIKDAKLGAREVKHLWIKTKDYSAHVHNPEFEMPEFDPDKIDWDLILSDVNLPKIEQPSKARGLKGVFDRLVFTDTHIGMTPNDDGFSLYGGVWDESELMNRCNRMVFAVMQYKNSNTLIIDDLGDLMDGWDGKTTRMGHDLPQNMNNQKAFDVALKFKIYLTSMLCSRYERVIVNNICEDNHSGAFGYVVNSAYKTAIETMTENVKVSNHRKFINHYRVKR